MSKYVVRCGRMRTLYVMSSRGEHPRGRIVIARTNRGLERGEVLCEATDRVIAQMSDPLNGSIQRDATLADEQEYQQIQKSLEQDFELCKGLIRETGLPMSLVDVERIFGGELVVVYYTADDRVDFRELVKKLSGKFQTRIEMRQIGARDEAKVLADYGDCGQPVCCNNHLSSMPPVSMRMAKLQKATLDPNKISGRCGRLKCCLRYENDTYEELVADMPPPGSEIVTPQGKAKVLGQEILGQQLLIMTEDDRRILIPVTDCLTVIKRGISY
ncbi:PSP1 domain-containing protein [Pirellulaceae bacterium SH449]